MSITLSRHAVLESVHVEAVSGIDAQGMPSYDSPVNIDAFVTRHNTVDETGTRMGNGDLVKGIATLLVDGAATVLPLLHDRVTLADGARGTVGEYVEAVALNGTLDHVSVTLRAVV